MRSGPTVDPFTWKYGGSTFFSLFIAKPDHMQMTTCILSILRYTKPSRFPPSSICPLRHIYYSRRQRYPFDMYSTTRLSSATAFTAALSSTSSHCSRHLTMNNLIAIQASHPVSLPLPSFTPQLITFYSGSKPPIIPSTRIPITLIRKK